MSNERIEFLYLSEPDMIEAGVLDMKACVEVMEEVFRLIGQQDCLMGGPSGNTHGIKLWFPKEKRSENMPIAENERRFMAMIAYVGGGYNVCGEKWYGSNIANKDKGLPRSILNITLNDPDTGAPLAYCSGNLVSAMRTGAVPGVATKYLHSKEADTIGIVGAGVMNRATLQAIVQNLKHKKLAKIYNRTKSKAEAMCDELRGLLDIELVAVDTLEEAIRNSDVISIATSGENNVKIDDTWIKEGALIHLVGAAELSKECYKNSKIVVDNWKMHNDWIEEALRHPDGIESVSKSLPSAGLLKAVLNKDIPQEDIINLGDIVNGLINGRLNDKEKIIFVTGGIPAEDIAWAYRIYENAKEKGIGQKLLLWDKPFWA